MRRLRMLRSLILTCHATEKDLAACGRDDINSIVAFAHAVLRSPKSKRDFIINVKGTWRALFPDADQQGRPDESVMPYVVRHLSGKVDRSREKRRADKFTWEEYANLLQAFAQDKRLQALFALMFESLRRPQELLYCRVCDVETFDNYAKVWISSHGKEGPGLAQCIDSYPYLVAWLNEHPQRHDPNAFLFINLGTRDRFRQMNPINVNKHLRFALKSIGIDKRITCYSFKRNGVTLRRLRGDSDVTIQRAAGWSSTKQLQTYDLSDQEDAYKSELIRRGIIPDTTGEGPKARTCTYCGFTNGIADAFCGKCKRPLDRRKVQEAIAAGDESERLRTELGQLRTDFSKVNEFMNVLLATNPDLVDALARKVAVDAKAVELLRATQRS